MPRKKQKSGPAPRSHRPSGPGKAGSAPSSQARHKPAGSKQDPTAGGAIKEGSQKKQSLQANQRPIVPFLRGDRILLVGEGEYFSPDFLIIWSEILGLCFRTIWIEKIL